MNTPRTDAECQKYLPHAQSWIPATFARQLERELNEANEKIKQLEADKARLDWLLDNDCIGFEKKPKLGNLDGASL